MKIIKNSIKSSIKSRLIKFALFSAVFLPAISGCDNLSGKRHEEHPMIQFKSFRDVPGVTNEEIRVIEAFQERGDSFIYGMPLSTEAFFDEDGEVRGYSALLCEWLSEFFGIPFEPRLYDWLDLLAGLETGEISFSGELTATAERQGKYFMTSDIASRPLKYFRLEHSKPLVEIAKERPIRCGFIQDTNTIITVVSELEAGTFDTVLLSDVSLVYEALKSGKIDAFYYSGTAEANFFGYSDLVTFQFYPLTYRPVSLTTQDRSLLPIISVIEKVLENGGIRHLIMLYNRGEQEYLRYKLFTQLTEEEREYIKNNPVVPIGADPGNYPASFYGKYEQAWRGTFFDIMAEVASLTGLSFERANDEHTEWPAIYQMLVDGRVAIVPELTESKEREGQFLWPATSLMTDYFSLISRSDYPDIKINEVLFIKVGVARNIIYTDIFKKWFPNHMNTVEYESMEDAFDALLRGEVEMVMASQKRLLYLTHYLELPEYKANIIFSQAIDIKMGFNKDEPVLCSIVSKALRMIDTKEIVDNWMRKTYDYRSKLAEAQRPWLIRVSLLSLLILILITFLFIRSRSTEKRLGQLVKSRTSELEFETNKLQAIFNSIPDILYCKDLKSLYTQYNKVMAEYFETDEKELIGKDDEGIGLPADVAKDLIALDNKTIDGRSNHSSENWILSRKKGIERLFETIKAPLTQNGSVVGLIGIARDITERKAMEEEAKAASRSKTTFLANMSHEMRTPMNVVVGLTDLMLEEDDPSVNLKENLRKISTAGSTLLGLINDVLDISKIEAGKLELMPTQYDLPSILNDIITLNTIRIEDKPITFQLDIDKDLPCSLYGDDLRIKQIINNILSNAFKYTHQGTVTLGIRCERDGSADVLMSVYVSDTGIGIREDDLKKLFTDYNQLDIHANRHIEGTGLGLSITKKLVDLMAGEISVESEYGKGTTFRLIIKQGFVSDKIIGYAAVESLRSFNYSDSRKLAHEKLVRSDLSYA
ncbi:MAG: transporter substrate-binding domain-containing protein, partial [Treponema sp.]|nr:transporter substrate-binding domain-containing protein [Treponema sp.]